MTPAVKQYVDRIKSFRKNGDTHLLIAHAYVRYLGDMRGGQMIAKKIPGNGKYYHFNNSQHLANSIYRLLNDDMAEEAKKVFNFATLLFKEMYEMMSQNNEL